MTDALSPPPDLAELAQLSARVGADPLLIQSAGGNTSLKDGDTMWIKASGTLLAEARTRDIFVPCDLPGMRAALASGELRADRPAEFARVSGGLRPSIETSLHAVFPQRVVVHVHCVNTIALAIRADAREALASRLAAENWAHVRYAKPGAMLAALVRAALARGTDTVILGNHGLIVAAETVAEAETLLDRVVSVVKVEPAAAATADAAKLGALVRGSDFVPLPPGHPLHRIALEPARLAYATGGSLYPDHVIFCGVGAAAVDAGETPAMAAARHKSHFGTEPVFLLAPGAGALLRRDASVGAKALTRCLGDVLARVPEGARLNYLTVEENAELLDWDAEKYRQALNAG